MSTKPTLLIISFSDISRDARVLKQVRQFADDYAVTTCGYGPAPAGVAEHIRIPENVRHNDLQGRLITAKLYRRAYWSLSSVRWCCGVLSVGSYDIVLANEVDAVPLALSLKPAGGVHADLHEYHSRMKEELPLWNRRIRPYVEWLCRRYVSRADSWTTVSDGIAAEYQREFGFHPIVVTNATPYRDLDPTRAHVPLRFVHSGAALRARHLEATVEAFLDARSDATLDLYLTPNDPVYLDEIRSQADRSGGRVRVRDAVPYESLIDTLHGYDLGIHVLPPVNFNHRWALPNKVFDYVQARLGIVVGPSPEMARMVQELGLGVVTAGFESPDITQTIDRLTASEVDGMKSSADAHAAELAADAEVRKWRDAIDALASR